MQHSQPVCSPYNKSASHLLGLIPAPKAAPERSLLRLQTTTLGALCFYTFVLLHLLQVFSPLHSSHPHTTLNYFSNCNFRSQGVPQRTDKASQSFFSFPRRTSANPKWCPALSYLSILLLFLLYCPFSACADSWHRWCFTLE